MSFVPKYRKILDLLIQRVNGANPGDRLPTVRKLMAEYSTSQSAIERCLDELDRQGLIRRRRGSGIFIAGTAPSSTVIGVYTDGEMARHSNDLFLKGVRTTAEKQGFQVADFGSKDKYQAQSEILASMESLGCAGIITALSTSNFFRLENESRLKYFRNLALPLVTCLPIPSVAADSIMPDYFSSFRELGRLLRPSLKGPVKFLGHHGIPTLARLQGLEVGLTQKFQVEAEILHKTEKTAFERITQLIRENWEGNLIIGVPPDKPGLVEELTNSRWTKDSKFKLAITLEEGNVLPSGVVAYKVIKPSFQIGALATEMLLSRIGGFRGEMTHKLIKHKLMFGSKALKTLEALA